MYNMNYYQGKKLYEQLRKTALSLTPQAMYNQFKRPSAGSARELYYIYKDLRLRILGLMSHVTIITRMAYLVPSPRYGLLLKLFLGFET